MTKPLSEAERARIHEAVLEHTSDSLFYTDAEGVIVWNNRANAERLGYEDPEDLVGTRAVDLYVNPRARGHMMKEILQTGQSRDFVALLKRVDGGSWYAGITCDAVRDAAGRVIGVVGVARDITERRHLAEDLNRLQEFNEMVLNTIPTCLWTVDLDGRITWVNGGLCRLAGCRVGDLVDRSIFDDAPDWIAAGRDRIRQVLDTGRVASAEAVERTLPDGHTVYLDLTVLPLREEGELSGAIVEAIDVTNRVRLQQELDALKGN